MNNSKNRAACPAHISSRNCDENSPLQVRDAVAKPRSLAVVSRLSARYRGWHKAGEVVR
jgi:hypothetical protein